MEERLQKVLANAGVASRRKCEELILDGKVKVNGKVVTELGTKVEAEKDKIEYNGKQINKVDKYVMRRKLKRMYIFYWINQSDSLLQWTINLTEIQ